MTIFIHSLLSEGFFANTHCYIGTNIMNEHAFFSKVIGCF